MANRLDEIHKNWRFIVGQAPVPPDLAQPWYLDEESNTLLVVSAEQRMTAFLQSAKFAACLNEVYPGLRIRAEATDGAGLMFAQALKSIDQRLRRLGV